MTGIRWQSLRCVAFDFDGTLVDSNAIKRASYFDALAGTDASGPVIEQMLREHPRDDRRGILTRVHARLQELGVAGLPAVDDLVERYSSVCEAKVIACDEIPGAIAALEALSNGHALYLASATPEDALQRVVAGREWGAYFRGVYGGPRTKVENLERIAAREGLARDEIVYVGDGAVDREAADLYGCPFLGFGTRPESLPPGTGPLAALRTLAATVAARG